MAALPNLEADNVPPVPLWADDFDDVGVGDVDDFDSICSLCDDGGSPLCCAGGCRRSFHATIQDGSDSLCPSLGFTPQELDALAHFMCQNCVHMGHQCFACGVLGNSNNAAGNAEVFTCSNGSCEYFYHPNCIAQLLHPNDSNAAVELQRTIAAGEPFICPLHNCCICEELENPNDHDLQLAQCRRCPKAYHRRCLPGEIAVDAGGGRAWSKLLPRNRILMYCLNHEMIPELATPAR